MKTILLCGGQGTRLREETEYRPKPMVEIGGRPILWHIMKTYSHHGFNKFVLCLGYKGHMIKNYFLDYEAMNNDFTIRLGAMKSIAYHNAHNEQDFEVTLADTGQDSMTGRRIRLASRYLDDDQAFMVTYGDGLSNIDLNALVAYHRSHGKLATVTAIRPTSRFGLIDVADNNQVKNFAEKPRAEGWASAGYFVFDRRVLDYLDDSNCMLEREPLEKLAADGQLMVYRHDDFFVAMDTFREYQLLNDMWNSGQAPWKVWS
ncbi:MAG: glucose-1-phosphate cytidylyltransferase [Isosphaeraceae bacterium]